ncbi:ATP-binding protein [Bdellovibrio bacteriovorus]|uniref:ATP-binding protein n=1 Tax=Bdellovibrio TaxID=958 RepID=UPI0035A87ACE
MKTAAAPADLYQKEILDNTRSFSEICAKNLASIFSLQTHRSTPSYSNSGIHSDKRISISVLFTGVVYGEFILAMSEETASKILNTSSEETFQDEVVDNFGELLNLIVGEGIVGLTKIYSNLTITAPKIYFGKIRYPKVKCGKVTMQTPHGDIECFLYVDHMKLDIATSYQEAMSSLVVANQELRDAMQRLEQQQAYLVHSEKMTALGTMAAGVAHEINTPLATISLVEGHLKNLLKEPDELDRNQFNEMLNVIESTVTRISSITNALRSYAKSSMGLAPQSVSVVSVIEEALMFCQSQLNTEGIVLIRDDLKETLNLECRHDQLSQVFYNLLINACDAIQPLEKKWIRIEGFDRGDDVEIRVTDSGASLPKELRTKIFDPFFTTKDFGKGMGLGLSISKGIVEIHKGEIFVSPDSHYTQFVMRLPKKQSRKVAA